MKKLLTLSLVAIATLLAGCGHDHEKNGWKDKGDHKEYSIGDKGHSDQTDMSITVKAPKKDNE